VSKLFKSLVALLMIVALFIPKIMPTHAMHGNPQEFGRPPEGELGSITVVRVAGDAFTVTPPGYLVAGVPIRVQQVQFTVGAVPSMTNLADPEWVNEHVILLGTPIYGATGTNGEVLFDDLPQGIWLVQELASATIDGVTVTNPIEEDQFFADFVVGVPRWVEDDNVPLGGRWDFHVRVYPKSEIPPDGGEYKEAIYYSSNVATWELGHLIPAEVALLPYFSATDMLPSGLQFIPGSVEGRFERSADEDGWNEATGQLVYGTHFTVSATSHHPERGQSVTIVITEAGRARLANQGLLGTGYVMFRLDTEILYGGRHTNDSRWDVGEPKEPCPDCEPCPTCPDSDCPPCPPCPDCPNDTIDTFYLEILKLNTAQQRLQGAQFRVYRELTATEAALEGIAWTEFVREYNIYDRGANANPRFVMPLQNSAGNVIQGTTDANGLLNFPTPMSSEGANAPRIWVRETAAPAGYRIIDQWIPVTITSNYAASGAVRVTVFNEPISGGGGGTGSGGGSGSGGGNLPQTGTIVMTLTGVGLVLVVSGLVIVQAKRKKNT